MKNVALILVVTMIIFTLTACGGISPDKAVTEFMDAVKEVNVETIEKYVPYNDIAGKNSLAEDKEFAKNFFDGIEYKVISSVDNKDTAKVEIEITNINLGDIMKQFMGQMFTEALSSAFSEKPEELSEEEQDIKYKEQFTNLIETNKENKVTNVVTINLTKVENNWKIEMTEELQNALMGNLNKATEEINNSFNKK